MQPKVKIMMSTYNGEKYLEKQIISILSQKNVIVKLYVRDDGSTDRTTNILRNMQNKYDNIIVNICRNVGPSRSFMELLYDDYDLSYDYYAFSDQDDIWEDDKLIRAIDMINNIDNSSPVLYYSALQTFNEITGVKKLVVNKREYSFEESFLQSHFPGCTMVINNKGMHFIRDFNKPEVAIMHDLFVAQLFLGMNNKIIYDKESRINYRIHGNNVSVKKDNLLEEFSRYIKIWKRQKGIRLASANAFKKVVGNSLNNDKLKVLNSIIEYKKSLVGKLKFIGIICHSQLTFKVKFMYIIAVLIDFY